MFYQAVQRSSGVSVARICLVLALVFLRLDYCNSVLVEIRDRGDTHVHLSSFVKSQKRQHLLTPTVVLMFCGVMSLQVGEHRDWVHGVCCDYGFLCNPSVRIQCPC